MAIDVPTGLCGDSGALLGRTAARADLTLCIGLWKRGLVQDRALGWVGRLERVDLGCPGGCWSIFRRTNPWAWGGRPQIRRWMATGTTWKPPDQIPIQQPESMAGAAYW